MVFHVVVFEKGDGILCKKISLNPDGTFLKTDGSECRMSVGTAELQAHNLQTFADMIEGLAYQQAIALGAFGDGIPNRVRVETKWMEAHTIFPDGRPADLIVRSAEYIEYLPHKPALLLIDVDTKALPKMVREKIRTTGGFWQTLVTTLPTLAPVGHVTRPSTSTGLSRVDTNERLPGSEGLHIYVVAENGADINRFLRALHDRCWLSGFGWLMVGRAGQFLSRSIVDRMVGDGCRLVFEAPALTVSPVVQDRASRKPVVVDGPALDTGTCPDLTVVQRERLRELVAVEKQRLAPEAARARADFIERQAARIVEKAGGEIGLETARHIVERQTDGLLLPHVVLEFDHLGEITVAEVLEDPAQYVGQTLSDPLEGPGYGPCKAQVMRRADGTLMIYSYAHGQGFFSLRHDVRSLEKAILGAPEAKAADLLISMIADAEIDPLEEERLKNLVYARAKGTKPKPLGAQIKTVRADADKQRKEEARQRQQASRTNQRVRMPAPRLSSERLPIITAVDEVLADDPSEQPPMRNDENMPTELRCHPLAFLHDFQQDNANYEESADGPA